MSDAARLTRYAFLRPGARTRRRRSPRIEVARLSVVLDGESRLVIEADDAPLNRLLLAWLLSQIVASHHP